MLKQVGEALSSPQHKSEMARQLDVHLRTVMRWDKGETAFPEHAGAKIGKLLHQRQREIDRLLAKIASG